MVPSPALAIEAIDNFAIMELAAKRPWTSLFRKKEITHGQVLGTREHGKMILVDKDVFKAVSVYDYVHYYDGAAASWTFRVSAKRQPDILEFAPPLMLAGQAWVEDASGWAPSQGSHFVVVREPAFFIEGTSVLTVQEWVGAIAGKYAKTGEMIMRFRKVNELAQARIKAGVTGTNGFLNKLKLKNLKIIEVPTLFWNKLRSDTLVDCVPFTANLANGIFLPGQANTFLMSKPFVAESGGKDIFESKADEQLGPGYKPEYVDVYYYMQLFEGEVKCGVECVREPWGRDLSWWDFQ